MLERITMIINMPYQNLRYKVDISNRWWHLARGMMRSVNLEKAVHDKHEWGQYSQPFPYAPSPYLIKVEKGRKPAKEPTENKETSLTHLAPPTLHQSPIRNTCNSNSKTNIYGYKLLSGCVFLTMSCLYTSGAACGRAEWRLPHPTVYQNRPFESER